MITDEQFVQALRSSKLTTAELANNLSVSQPTIRRWRNGRNLPHQAMRPGVLSVAKESNGPTAELEPTSDPR